MNVKIPSLSLPPLNVTGAIVLSLAYQQRVGQPEISSPSTQLRVPSKLARTTLGFCARASAAASKCGAIVLQCPHQGAQIFNKTYFSVPKTADSKLFPTIVLTAVVQSVGIGADFKNGLIYPASTWATKVARLSADTSEASPTYFFLASTRQIRVGVVSTLTPRYSANLLKWSLFCYLSTVVKTRS